MNANQMRIVAEIQKADATGLSLDIDQLMEILGKSCSKQAIQSSLNYLESKKTISKKYETRRNKRRLVVFSNVVH